MSTTINADLKQLTRIHNKIKMIESPVPVPDRVDGITFQQLLEHMLNGVAYCHMLYEGGQPSDFIYLYTNPSFEQLTGLKNVTGKLVSEVIPGIRQSDPELFKIYGSVAAGGPPVKFETYIEALGMWFSLSVYSSKQDHFIAMFDVITERKLIEKQLRQSEEIYRTLFETVAQGVVYQDREGRIISANPTAERLLGLTLEQMQGRTSIDPRWGAIHEDGSAFPGETHPTMQAIKTGKLVNNVVMGINNPMVEHPVWIRINAIPIFKKGTEEIDYAYSTFEDITEHKKAEIELEQKSQQLLQSEEQLRCVLRGSELGFWDWNIVTNEVQRNEQWAEMLGYAYAELQNTTMQWTDFVHPDDREKAWQSIHDVLEGKSPAHKAEYRMLHKDGSTRWILDQANVIQRSSDGKPTRMSGTHTDITERKKAEEATSEVKKQLEHMSATVPGVVYQFMTTPKGEGRFLYVSKGIEKLYEVTAEEAYHNHLTLIDRIVPDDSVSYQESVERSTANLSYWEHEYRIMIPNGKIKWVLGKATPQQQADGTVLWNGILTDTTERVQLMQELEHLAKTDALTGIANRRHFLELAELEITRSRRYHNLLTIMMMDIDFFKTINDNYGHKVGDLVLQKLAAICKEVLREVDIIGRLGGEEFAILLPETAGMDAMDVAERMRQELENARVELADQATSVIFTVSIGIAAMTSQQETVDSLLQDADAALYQAKNSGRNKVVSSIRSVS